MACGSTLLVVIFAAGRSNFEIGAECRGPPRRTSHRPLSGCPGHRTSGRTACKHIPPHSSQKKFKFAGFPTLESPFARWPPIHSDEPRQEQIGGDAKLFRGTGEIWLAVCIHGNLSLKIMPRSEPPPPILSAELNIFPCERRLNPP